MELSETIQQAVERAIQNHKPYTSPKLQSDIVDIDGASEFTGYSKNSIYSMTCRREIPFIKRPGGRKLFFSKKALETWILGQK
jgi:predicted DNA-binding transcriptional regulator AlpA